MSPLSVMNSYWFWIFISSPGIGATLAFQSTRHSLQSIQSLDDSVELIYLGIHVDFTKGLVVDAVFYCRGLSLELEVCF